MSVIQFRFIKIVTDNYEKIYVSYMYDVGMANSAKQTRFL